VLLLGKRAEAECNEATFGDQINKSEAENHELDPELWVPRDRLQDDPGVMRDLPELRQRLGELPRDREIIAYCQSGQRSYIAARILSQHGFRVRNLTGAYCTWRATRPQ